MYFTDVAVGTTPTLLPHDGRKPARVSFNRDVWLGGSGVTVGTGLSVAAGNETVLPSGRRWYAIARAPAQVDIRELDDAKISRVATFGAFSALNTALRTRQSCALQILGDSTGNDTTEWVYRLAQKLASDNPEFTVKYILWSDASQSYGAVTTIQTGTDGELYLDGDSSGANDRQLPASASPHLSGVIDVRVKMSMTDWTPSSQRNILGKSGADPNRGWYVFMTTLGNMGFAWTTDGTAGTLASLTGTTPPTVVDGDTTWLRWVFTPNNGSAQKQLDIYQSTNNGGTWTQLGSSLTSGGVVTVFNNSTWGYEIGGSSSGKSAGVKIYEVQFRNGLNGPIVAPVLPDLWPPYNTTSIQTTGAPTLYIVNGSHAGANITYLGDSTRLPKMTPNYGQVVTFISDSHNEGSTIGKAWRSTLETFVAAVAAQVDAPVVLIAQNPQTNAAVWYRTHARRAIDTVLLATLKKYGAIDIHSLFSNNPNFATEWMQDTAHPNAIGSQLWADEVYDVIKLDG